MATRTKSTHAAAAQAIRQDLKKAWPGVRFRVRSDSFSMGNSVDVHWTDGPTSADVNLIIGRYQYGHFDGMQDLYEYSNRRKDIPQAKYVSGSREMSADVRAEIFGEIVRDYYPESEREGITENSPAPNGWGYVSEMIWREFSQRSYCDQAKWMPEEPEEELETVEPEQVQDVEPRPMFSSIMQPQSPARSHEDELDELIRSRVLDMMQLDSMACITEVVQ